MTRRLILHVGAPKCGSTYLQRVMLANRDPLSSRGIVYPAPEGSHPGNGLRLAGIDPAGMETLFGGARTAVLSHEDLISLGPRMTHLPGLCAEHDVALTVLVFLRPFCEVIYGDYSQFMKQNFDRYLAEGQAYDGMSFEEFAVARRSKLTPTGWLNAWQRTTPLPLRIAPHRRIRATLEEVLDGAEMNWDIEAASANPSLRVCDCEDIARAMQAGLRAAKIREMYKLAYAKVALADHGRTETRRVWLEALFRNQNENIRDTFRFDNRWAA
ncbi:hypothetical protein [Mangrovicoccus algicola]|uniref:Uncharacterized protein n=1 Tax=Mangrovicoccus algicola TaxID=2771008 RepID=A0A8J6Z177_9RHOB|nr:hypothetical protein [Mangrovicoccus algicola]MBE3639788.1 hypothetical protein [Mangrovicoccus algicola]